MITDNSFWAEVQANRPAAGVGDWFQEAGGGEPIQRITDAATILDKAKGSGMLPYVAVEYAPVCPFNADNSRLLLVHFSYFALYEWDGKTYRYAYDLPFEINASARPRWDPFDKDVLYFLSGSAVKEYNCATRAIRVLRDFQQEYDNIDSKGEADISPDGRILVLVGDDRYIFLYNVKTGAVSPVLDAAGHSFNNVYMMSDSHHFLVSWVEKGEGPFRGVEMFEWDLSQRKQLTRAMGHMATGMHTDGSTVLIWTPDDDSGGTVCGESGIALVNMQGGQRCIFKTPWTSLLVYHVSCASKLPGWAIVETFSKLPVINPYMGEILAVRTDGSEVRRLAHHRSRPAGDDYTWQPKSSISRDGSRLVFMSNWGGPVADVYWMYTKLTSMVEPPLATPTPAPSTPTEPVPFPKPPDAAQALWTTLPGVVVALYCGGKFVGWIDGGMAQDVLRKLNR